MWHHLPHANRKVSSVFVTFVGLLAKTGYHGGRTSTARPSLLAAGVPLNVSTVVQHQTPDNSLNALALGEGPPKQKGFVRRSQRVIINMAKFEASGFNCRLGFCNLYASLRSTLKHAAPYQQHRHCELASLVVAGGTAPPPHTHNSAYDRSN